MLSKLGFNIDIYEAKDSEYKESHSIALALSARGIRSIETAGVDIKKLASVPMFGLGIHQTNGEFQFL